ncbi:hypothetical protein VXI92_003557 [Enterobacter hormaechei]|uniref:hypothetical protein n=1 Tax=Enterobacter hormaechei TaxID=158836 RepID=UPI00177F828A|nr:hypothetical protein [Enterobacter hormaechei]HAV1674496.1 hypothetical protein [Enterobacter hormaechei subsp. xiangfangensis]EME0310868.1 hypothetical protein [Enterobacter hormaechei]MBE0223598.1 hypothetical protein [Enterobacter hormaechei]HAV1892897.1 hypothetical protein [Enterobacter hormaechei subsp. xiangfangensis]HAV1947112.1 hypothetical protein [Enterobacter hormaechei subsp. xiangfangensis]
MEEFKGTPGPWTGKDVGICRQDDAGLQLGFIMTFDEKRRDECSANAHLIAAAPELLEELIETHSALCFTSDYLGSLRYERNKAAIDKALGK